MLPRTIFVSRALRGHTVAVICGQDGWGKVMFYRLVLGRFAMEGGRQVEPIPALLAASEVLSRSVPADVVVSAMTWHKSVNDVLTHSHGHGHDHVYDHDLLLHSAGVRFVERRAKHCRKVGAVRLTLLPGRGSRST